jgi:Protease subunit of ATP-dependent Clp proteases
MGVLRLWRIRLGQRDTSLAAAVSHAGFMTTETRAPVMLDEQLAMQLLAERIIVLGAEVDDPIANRITAQLLLLSARDPRADISLYINSPGGSVTAGLAIYDTMRVVPNDVSTLAVGFAASMGQFLLGAGTPGKRFALPNARIMMHQPSAGIQGTAADVEVQANNLKTMKRRVNELQSQHTGQTVEQITADSERDRWFSADEAMAYGIVDHVVASLTDVRPAPAVRRVGLG